MPDDNRPPPPEEPAERLPEPEIVSPRRFRVSMVWIIPLVAAFIGGWLVWQAVAERGPSIALVFDSAEGLEPGRTTIKYRYVDVGKVADVALSPDRKTVVVTAEMRKDIEQWLVEDTRFWVVRPRLAGGGISGLGTLISGAYIGMDIGNSKVRRYRFEGLAEPPILTSDREGRRFVLKGEDIGSLDVGSPVYFRRIIVGQVLGFELDRDGAGITLPIFVEAPYDRFVTPNTRFWQASGLDLTLDANGVKVNTESLTSILLGGLAFGNRQGEEGAEPARENTEFRLFENEATAMAPPKAEPRPFVLYFNESVRGLAAGAPLDFRGLPAGEVTGVRGEWDRRSKRFRIAVDAAMRWGEPRRNTEGKLTEESDEVVREQMQRLVDQGLRAQLRFGNVLSGQLYVALDFFADTAPARIDWNRPRPEFPTMPGALQSFSESADRIIKKLDKLPLQELTEELRQALRSLDKTLRSAERLASGLDRELAPAVRATLREADRTLGEARQVLAAEGPLQQDVRGALDEVAQAAASLRLLLDYLERNPESLLFGKDGARK
jgi:paraquat-inducible protein B